MEDIKHLLDLRQRGRDLGHALVTARCDQPLCRKLVEDELKAAKEADMDPGDFASILIAATGAVLESVHNAAHALDDLAGWRAFDASFQYHLRHEAACAAAADQERKDK